MMTEQKKDQSWFAGCADREARCAVDRMDHMLHHALMSGAITPGSESYDKIREIIANVGEIRDYIISYREKLDKKA